MNDEGPFRFLDRERVRAPGIEENARDPIQRALTQPEPEAADDFGAFGWLRGIRDRAVMLELRMRTGNIVAIGYAWLERVEFDPSVGITLLVPGQRIVIRGQNLNYEVRPGVRLFEGIARHRVAWIQEARCSRLAATNVTHIQAIRLQ